MKRTALILILSSCISGFCWSQSNTKDSKTEKADFAKSQDGKNLNIKIPAGSQTNATPHFSGTNATLLFDVLFATNEDCDLYIGEELKGTVYRNKHKYIKLPSGSYVYKARSKSTSDELKETFAVSAGDSNEVFMDLLYVVDEQNQQRESLKKKNLLDSQLLANKNKLIPPKPAEKKIENKEAAKIEPAKETANKKITSQPEEKKVENKDAAKIEPDKKTEDKVIIPGTEKKVETNNETEKALINSLLANMVSIRSGSYVMGNNKAQSVDETEHAVTIGPVLFGKYEVTQQEWDAVMEYNPSNNKGCKTCPVENVSWEEVMTFIDKLNEKTNKKFRLPTEAEWEFVAKLGGKAEIDKYGGQEEYIKKTAWYYGNSNKKTHQIGQKLPNVSGIYDLFGNVSEWCSDWYDADYYKKETNQKNPKGPISGKEKVIRGGSFNDSSGDRFRPSLRNKLGPERKNIDTGFRLIMDVNQL
jgi:formylglycine-generating enzyme required for sulfatase activity